MGLLVRVKEGDTIVREYKVHEGETSISMKDNQTLEIITTLSNHESVDALGVSYALYKSNEPIIVFVDNAVLPAESSFADITSIITPDMLEYGDNQLSAVATASNVTSETKLDFTVNMSQVGEEPKPNKNAIIAGVGIVGLLAAVGIGYAMKH